MKFKPISDLKKFSYTIKLAWSSIPNITQKYLVNVLIYTQTYFTRHENATPIRQQKSFKRTMWKEMLQKSKSFTSKKIFSKSLTGEIILETFPLNIKENTYNMICLVEKQLSWMKLKRTLKSAVFYFQFSYYHYFASK